MIEKLGEFDIEGDAFNAIVDNRNKINELVDAVNKLIALHTKVDTDRRPYEPRGLKELL